MPKTLQFCKKYILRSKIEFNNLINNGKAVNVFPFYIKYIVSSSTEQTYRLKIAFSVRKKSFKKAVIRNRIRRMVREAVRLNKQIIESKAIQTNKSIHLLIVYNSSTITNYQEIEKQLIISFEKLADKINM